MKKIALTLAIVLGLSMTTFADGGGLFQRGANPEEQNGVFGNRTDPATPLLPNHGLTGNQDADQVPMGTGIAVLAALGGAYLVAKKRREVNRSKIKAIDFRKISCEAIQKKHFLPKAIPKQTLEKGVTARWRLFLCELASEIFMLDLRKIYFQKPSTSPKGNLRVIRVPPCL